MNLLELRKNLEACLQNSIRDPNKGRVLISRRATGSASGLPFESWTRDMLRSCGFLAFLQEEFLEYVVKEMKHKGYASNRIEYMITKETWWGLGNYVISSSQLDAALRGRKIPTYQQSMADIILFYGNDIVQDLNDVILINVKSHDIDRESRDPNIISAKRVLEFFKDLLEKSIRSKSPQFIDKANLWFIGIYYKRYEGYSKIVGIYVKDFFKLDVTKIPVINFDAAIQIQWHVKNMIEREDIDKLSFIESLANEYLKRWQEFVKRRTIKLEETVNELKRLVNVLRNKNILMS